MNGYAAKVAAIALAAMLASCGGGGATGGGSGGGAGATNTAVGTSGTPQQSPSSAQQAGLTLQFGAPGSSATPNVQVGGSATVSAVVKDASGAVQPNVLVTFTPPSVAALNPAVGTALTDANGVASITVEGLTPGAGMLTATATIGGTQYSATLAFAVAPAGTSTSSAALFGSVEYVAATKQTLNIAGAGSAATSDVSFRVKDQNGQPLANQVVTFTPTVTTGGITLQPTTAVSDAQGIVRTTVTAGTAPTPVRINATTTINGNQFSVQSLQLSVSSGNPSQKFFSVSVDKQNIDGCDFDGATATVTARAGDQFGNPVPDGTTVNFVTEGGRIGAASIGSCQTTNGACSVVLESQEFRPRNEARSFNNCRVTVLAYAVGQETFTDLNSNYRYDAGEPWDDLPDAFINSQPLVRSLADSMFPWTSRGDARNLAMGPTNFRAGADTLIKFTDVGQAVPTADGKWGNANVRGWVEVVFSGWGVQLCKPVPLGSTQCTAPDPIDFTNCTSANASASSKMVAFQLMDQNGNPLAAGTTVAATGVNATSSNLLPTVVDNTMVPGGTTHIISIAPDSTTCGLAPAPGRGAGQVRLQVKTPNGPQPTFLWPVVY